ncbi:hypothetical protein NC652_003680 [Populus alba x Populus x berolinensis]|nr:hypothetical protein NC652_003680 [Populus alba x Populus x berolinensis]
MDTYNIWLKERHGDDLLIHLDLNSNLWLEKGSSDGPNRNRVNGLPNIMVENLWTTRSVSTIGFSQSILSTQTPKFEATLDQRVNKNQTTHFAIDYKRLSAKTTKLYRLVMEIRSQLIVCKSSGKELVVQGEDSSPLVHPT